MSTLETLRDLPLSTLMGFEPHREWWTPQIVAWLEKHERFVNAMNANESALCMCKDRPLADCPGEWEPGCDLGNNENFAMVHKVPEPSPTASGLSAKAPNRMTAITLTEAELDKLLSAAYADGRADQLEESKEKTS